MQAATYDAKRDEAKHAVQRASVVMRELRRISERYKDIKRNEKSTQLVRKMRPRSLETWFTNSMSSINKLGRLHTFGSVLRSPRFRVPAVSPSRIPEREMEPLRKLVMKQVL